MLTNWGPVPEKKSTDPYFFAAINSVSVANGVIFTVGNFNIMNGAERHGAAAFDATTGALLPWDPNADWIPVSRDDSINGNADFSSVVAMGNSVFIAGLFDRFSDTLIRGFAAVEAVTGQLLEWNPASLPNVTPYDKRDYVLTADSSAVFIHSDYRSVARNVDERIGLAELAPDQLNAPTAWNPKFVSTTFDVDEGIVLGNAPIVKVNALAVSGDTLFVGGIFDSIDESPRTRLAAFDLATHTLLDWRPNIKARSPFTSSYVSAIAVVGDTVFVAGALDTINGTPREYLAAICVHDGLVLPWNPNPNGTVTTIAAKNGRLYVGGIFSSISGVKRNGFAVFDIRSMTLLPSLGDIDSGAQVYAIAFSDSVVFLSGSQIGLNVNPAEYGPRGPGLIGFETLTGTTVWHPVFTGGIQRAIPGILTIDGSRLYSACALSPVGTFLSAYDLRSSSSANELNIQIGSSLSSALLVSGDTIYIGGTFTSLGDRNVAYFAKVLIPRTGSDVKRAIPTESAMSLFPNPASSAITISGPSVYDGPTLFHIIDIIGREIQTVRCHSNPATIFVNDIPAGSYRLQGRGVSAAFSIMK